MDDGHDNLLSRPLCFELTRALREAAKNPEIKVVLLTGVRQFFSRGYDTTALASDADRTALFDLVDTLVVYDKPTIAALQGDAFGGGLELAMLCAFRLAAPNTKIALPDIALGLPPGAGGTQTLPRVAGVKVCLDLLLNEKGAKTSALGAGLDAEINGDFQAGALRFAQALAAQDLRGFSMANRNEGFADPVAYQSVLFEARQAVDPQDSARLDVINAMESALLLPFTAGIEYEREVYKAAEARPASRALRYLALQAEALEARNANVIGDHSGFDRVAVLGHSELSFFISAKLLLAGVNVTLVHGASLTSDDVRFDVLDAARACARASGRTSLHETSLSDQLTLTTDQAECATADVVMDASEDTAEALLKRAEAMGAILQGTRVTPFCRKRWVWKRWHKASGE